MPPSHGHGCPWRRDPGLFRGLPRGCLKLVKPMTIPSPHGHVATSCLGQQGLGPGLGSSSGWAPLGCLHGWRQGERANGLSARPPAMNCMLIIRGRDKVTSGVSQQRQWVRHSMARSEGKLWGGHLISGGGRLARSPPVPPRPAALAGRAGRRGAPRCRPKQALPAAAAVATAGGAPEAGAARGCGC
jgi:hypothetical protein